MAEAILCGVTQTIMENLGSAAFENFGPLWNVKDDIESIKNTVSRIQAVLLDAVEQPNRNHQDRDWLEKLKDAFYDADDLLGEYKFHIELDLQQEETSGNTAGKNKLEAQNKTRHKYLFRTFSASARSIRIREKESDFHNEMAPSTSALKEHLDWRDHFFMITVLLEDHDSKC
ncbi:putative disease resistance protein RGA1 isoform X2 [Quercus robur]|uniref:putative disease resistance protein RGA1 isoform X2 n=1 Tax=Quercus robur TaxID=38942 RepID=UPI002162162B|nr:putative disease resistance protein RGA1 isoform X2 [Quercus robur]